MMRAESLPLAESIADNSVSHSPASKNPDRIRQVGDAETLDLARLLSMTPAFELFSFAKCSVNSAIVFRADENQLIVVLTHPADLTLLARIDAQLNGRPFDTKYCAIDDIKAYLSLAERNIKKLDTLSNSSDASSDSLEEEALPLLDTDIASDNNIVSIVNSILQDSVKTGASDIHIETEERGLVIKFRVDGVLEAAGRFYGREIANQIISRLKVLSELDIAEKRVPQDGRFRVRVKTRSFDVRISIMPSIHGEDAVLRILDKSNLVDQNDSLTLSSLGFSSEELSQLRSLTSLPYGMVLVTGPTGSGKTTTLYGALNEINSGQDKIVTIEDPVEYKLNGVLQIPVNEKKGLTFAKGLRSILRHDPDKIMVGEIRDPETAQIAIQSALTGHLVLSTVHANSVFDVFSRFTHMGCEPFALASALNGIWAQRLIRLVCEGCAEPRHPNDEQIQLCGVDASSLFPIGKGCSRCRGTGYRGRTAMAEVLRLDDELRDMLISQAPITNIKQAARNKGLITLREKALALAKAGRTTLHEVVRVTV